MREPPPALLTAPLKDSATRFRAHPLEEAVRACTLKAVRLPRPLRHRVDFLWRRRKRLVGHVRFRSPHLIVPAEIARKLEFEAQACAVDRWGKAGDEQGRI